MLKHLVIALTLLQTLAWSAPIYIVGATQENNDIYTPTLWIAETTSLQNPPVAITLGAPSENATANSVISIGNKIFSVGRYGPNKNATLWITDVESAKTTRPSIITKSLSSNESEALGIIGIGTQLFIVGYEKQSGSLKATLWITDTSGTSPQTITLSADESKGNSIAFYKGLVYIVGNNTVASSTKPWLWITNVKGSTQKQIPLEAKDSGIASSIIITKNQLYCLGYNDTQQKGQFWITDLTGNIKKTKFWLSNYSFGYSCINIGRGIYNLVASTPGQIQIIPQIIITNTSGDSVGNVELYNSTPYGYGLILGTSSLASYSKKIYAVGYVLSNTGFMATLWELDSGFATSYTVQSKSSIAIGIFIPQGSQLLPAAVKKQTTKYQKGI